MSQQIVPSWLDESFFEKILQKNLKNSSVKVKNLKIEGCGDGKDGLLSQLFRVSVIYHVNSSDESEKFVVKLASTNGITLDIVGSAGYDVQNKEMNFFDVIAPQMEKVLKLIDDDLNIITKVVEVDHEHDAIVFEDLKPKGFEMAEKGAGIDEMQARITLKKLAKFHAASIILQEKYPKVFNNFDVGIFTRKFSGFNCQFDSTFEFVVEEVSTWPGFKVIAEKLEKLRPNLIENATKCFDVKPGDFCVLNHGDLWKNNLMFKSGEDGGVEDAIIIDFQFCHWASPVLDLMHFFYTSLNNELFKQSEIESFSQFYFYELKQALTKLNYDASKIPTLHQFQLVFLDKLFYGFIYTSCVFPIMISDDPDNDFSAQHSNDERARNFKRRIVKNQTYRMIMKRMLRVFEEKGVLDVLIQ